jgi:hypothetical protein
MALYDPYSGYTDNLIPTMTSNTAPSGTPSASTEDSSTYAAWKAMDGNTSSYWRTTSAGKTNCSLQYEFTSSKTITKYAITAPSTTSYTPKSWTFEGFNGSTWDTLDSQTNITSWSAGEKKSYEFTNTTAYTIYRIYITAQNGGTYTGIAEIEMMETLPQVTNVNVSSVNLQTEFIVDNVKISSINLQVEIKEPRLKYYDGSRWEGKPLKYFDGSQWTDRQLKYFNNSDWITGQE